MELEPEPPCAEPAAGTVTARHTLAATAIAAWLPRRVSPRKPPALWPVSAITQRIRPVWTSIAIHDAGTELSRPEKLLAGHVKRERRASGGLESGQRLGTAGRRVDLPAIGSQASGGGVADPRGTAGDQDRAVMCFGHSAIVTANWRLDAPE